MRWRVWRMDFPTCRSFCERDYRQVGASKSDARRTANPRFGLRTIGTVFADLVAWIVAVPQTLEREHALRVDATRIVKVHDIARTKPAEARPGQRAAPCRVVGRIERHAIFMVRLS